MHESSVCQTLELEIFSGKPGEHRDSQMKEGWAEAVEKESYNVDVGVITVLNICSRDI